MSESVSFTSGVSGRYATALFSIAVEDKTLDTLEKDLNKLRQIFVEASGSLQSLIVSPLHRRTEQEKAIGLVADKIKLSINTANLLALMARKRRLNLIPKVISDLAYLLEEQRGEMRVEVVSATALTKKQQGNLESMLEKLVGKKIKLGVQVNKAVIGGLIVKLGSRMIDSTVRSKLLKLQNIMKEVN